jgi:hypothetical protein
MTSQTDHLQPVPPPSPEQRLDRAIAALTGALIELMRLSVEDRAVPLRQIEILRLRRHQLSAIIDALTRFAGPAP